MKPAKPPLPLLRYFPFHPELGIQTSILMSESFAGLISAVTRQKAGRSLKFDGKPGADSSAPGVNWPAGTVWAEVMVVSFNLRLLRFSQVSAWASEVMKTIAQKSRMSTLAVKAHNVVIGKRCVNGGGILGAF